MGNRLPSSNPVNRYDCMFIKRKCYFSSLFDNFAGGCSLLQFAEIDCRLVGSVVYKVSMITYTLLISLFFSSPSLQLWGGEGEDYIYITFFFNSEVLFLCHIISVTLHFIYIILYYIGMPII